MTEMNNKVIVFRFSDQYCQAAYFDHTTHKMLFEKEYLYIDFLPNKIEEDEKAFLGEKGICYMCPEDKLQEKLNILQQRVNYQIPSPQNLWCERMMHFIEKGMKKAFQYNYETKGVLISLPRFLEPTLRKMIMNAITCCEEIFSEEERPLKFKVVDNVLSASVMYPKQFGKGLSKGPKDVDMVYVYCLVMEGFRKTEWSISIAKGEDCVILDSGCAEGGYMKVLQEVKYCMYHDDPNPEQLQDFDEWQKLAKNKYPDYLKTIANYNQVDATSFKDLNDDDKTIRRDYLMIRCNQHYKKITDKIYESINKVNAFLAEEGTIQIGSYKLIKNDLSPELRKVQGFYYDSLLKNWFFLESMKQYENCIPMQESNGTTENVIIGATYLSRMFSNGMIGREKYQEADQREKIHEENVAIELIEVNRFQLKRIENTEEGDVVLSFPSSPIVSHELIPMGKVEGNETNGIEYEIYDTLKDCAIARIHVWKTAEYKIKLINALGQYENNPLKKKIFSKRYQEWITDNPKEDESSENQIEEKTKLFENEKAEEEYSKDFFISLHKQPSIKTSIPMVNNLLSVEIIDRQFEVKEPPKNMFNYEKELVKHNIHKIVEINANDQTKLSFRSKISKHKNLFFDKQHHSLIQEQINNLKDLSNDVTELESLWDQYLEESVMYMSEKGKKEYQKYKDKKKENK